MQPDKEMADLCATYEQYISIRLILLRFKRIILFFLFGFNPINNIPIFVKLESGLSHHLLTLCEKSVFLLF